MLSKAINRANKDGMDLHEIDGILRACGYMLQGASLLSLCEDSSPRGGVATAEDMEVYVPEQVPLAVRRALSRRKVLWCKKIPGESQNFPKAMRLLGSPLEEVAQ